ISSLFIHSWMHFPCSKVVHSSIISLHDKSIAEPMVALIGSMRFSSQVVSSMNSTKDVGSSRNRGDGNSARLFSSFSFLEELSTFCFVDIPVVPVHRAQLMERHQGQEGKKKEGGKEEEKEEEQERKRSVPIPILKKKSR